MTIGQIKQRADKYEDIYICVEDDLGNKNETDMKRPIQFPVKCHFLEKNALPDETEVFVAYLLDEKQFRASIKDSCISFEDQYGNKDARVLCIFIRNK